jgi:hypothetical protein
LIEDFCILDSFYGERLARGRCPLQFGQQKQIDLIIWQEIIHHQVTKRILFPIF